MVPRVGRYLIGAAFISSVWAQPAAQRVPAQQQQSPAPLEFRMGSADEDLVRVYYLAHAATVQDFQEMVTLVRSITDIRRVFTYNARRAVVIRGTASQIGLADWLFKELDQPAERRAGLGQQAMPEYHVPGADESVVRVYYVQHAETVQDFQEMATVVRSIGEIRRVFTYNVRRAVALRGTAPQIATAEWILKELDKSVKAPGVAQQSPGSDGPSATGGVQ